jgi:hypothetical protein
MSADLRDRLHGLLGPLDDEHGDWGDVVARAGVAPPRGRRVAILALALLTLTVALFATPAFGLRDAVLDLIGREDVEFEQGTPAPAVIKQQFEDLSLGAPPRMDPQAIPEAMRRVGDVRIRGRERTLWVGPTRRGGFCYRIERNSGGCLHRKDIPSGRIALSYQAGSIRGGPVEAGPLHAWTFARDAARVTVEFEDGTRVDVPFTYVSSPIDAGFFAYDPSAQQRHEPHRPRRVAVYDAAGEELAHATITYHRETAPSMPSAPQELPAKPAVPPSEPVQTATVHGVRVVVGANASVIFDTTGAEPRTAELLDNRRASFVCFRFRAGEPRGYGISGGNQRVVGLRYHGIGTPFDGCEIQGAYGHRWPDRNDSHSAVEVAFTPAAQRFFEDRAAARDVALLVKMRKVQQLRKLTGDELVSALTDEFGSAIDRLPERDARPQPGRIGYWAGADRTVFRRVSTTDRVFEVEVRDGKIVRENLGELAMVF